MDIGTLDGEDLEDILDQLSPEDQSKLLAAIEEVTDGEEFEDGDVEDYLLEDGADYGDDSDDGVEELDEDAVMVKKKKKKRVDPAKSRAAKARYKKNRMKYEKGFKKFRNSSKGRAFYRKLGRFNSRHSESVETLIDSKLI